MYTAHNFTVNKCFRGPLHPLPTSSHKKINAHSDIHTKNCAFKFCACDSENDSMTYREMYTWLAQFCPFFTDVPQLLGCFVILCKFGGTLFCTITATQ